MELGLLQESSDEVVDRCILRKMLQEDIDIAWTTPTPLEDEVDTEDDTSNLSPDVRYVVDELNTIIEKAKKLKKHLMGENGLICVPVVSTEVFEVSNKVNDMLSMIVLSDYVEDEAEDIDSEMLNQDDDIDYYGSDEVPQMLYGDISL